MDAIYIPNLLTAPQRTMGFQFEEFFPNLETLTPVRGHFRVTYKTTFLEVMAKAETIVTLTCHRCLQQYNHRLSVNTSEMIWLSLSAGEIEGDKLCEEVSLEDLIETVSPQGYFEPEDWIYQQLCLALPLRQLCSGDCQPPQATHVDKNDDIVDQRWAALKALKQQFPG
ncbi:MAG: YceD family protein [Microcoleaceae cyanobacterium]